MNGIISAIVCVVYRQLERNREEKKFYTGQGTEIVKVMQDFKNINVIILYTNARIVEISQILQYYAFTWIEKKRGEVARDSTSVLPGKCSAYLIGYETNNK